MSEPYCPNREELGRNTLAPFSSFLQSAAGTSHWSNPSGSLKTQESCWCGSGGPAPRAQSRAGREGRDPFTGTNGEESAQCLRDCST